MPKSDLETEFAVGIMISGACLSVFLGPISAAIGMLIGLVLIFHSRFAKEGYAENVSLSLGMPLTSDRPVARPSTLNITLTPTSGPREKIELGVMNLGEGREFMAQCAPVARRNDPNQLVMKTFDLGWVGTPDRVVFIGQGESRNLLIATFTEEIHVRSETYVPPFSVLSIQELGEKEVEWSKWESAPDITSPEIDLEITILSYGAPPLAARFTILQRRYTAPIEMIPITTSGCSSTTEIAAPRD